MAMVGSTPTRFRHNSRGPSTALGISPAGSRSAHARKAAQVRLPLASAKLSPVTNIPVMIFPALVLYRDTIYIEMVLIRYNPGHEKVAYGG
jgi:hypothetical protein